MQHTKKAVIRTATKFAATSLPLVLDCFKSCFKLVWHEQISSCHRMGRDWGKGVSPCKARSWKLHAPWTSASTRALQTCLHFEEHTYSTNGICSSLATDQKWHSWICVGLSRAIKSVMLTYLHITFDYTCRSSPLCWSALLKDVKPAFETFLVVSIFDGKKDAHENLPSNLRSWHVGRSILHLISGLVQQVSDKANLQQEETHQEGKIALRGRIGRDWLPMIQAQFSPTNYAIDVGILMMLWGHSSSHKRGFGWERGRRNQMVLLGCCLSHHM